MLRNEREQVQDFVLEARGDACPVFVCRTLHRDACRMQTLQGKRVRGRCCCCVTPCVAAGF